ncbi:MAG: molybdopterin-dependent oxidoreductase, partial [Deltaproteobacteria bacterium]|nr:molybdopterin-dependent oxidoreductase [Deltaproteobacteria bacterium]
EVEVQDNRVTKIRPDSAHPVTKGYACVKGIRFDEVQHAPDRVVQPLERKGGELGPTTWDAATEAIGERLRAIIDEHGPQAVGFYIGNPCGFSTTIPIFLNGLASAVGTKKIFSVGSLDCNNKFRVSHEMYGSPFTLTFPDVKNTKFLMMIGANPAVSHTSVMQMPHPITELKAVEERGGRVVFLNPRRIETAKAVGEHHFIRPGTDVFFLLSFLRELLEIGAIDQDKVERHMSGLEDVAAMVYTWTPERTAEVTQVPAQALRTLARQYAEAKGASLFCSTGLNQGGFGTLAFWILEVINAVSGNLDRKGGSVVSRGAIDLPRLGKRAGLFRRDRKSRFGNLPVVADTLPATTLADEILTPGEGQQLKALFVVAGNPILSAPNPQGRLTRAFKELDLLVSMDIFRSETAELADFVLPGPTFLERPDLQMAFQLMSGTQPVRYLQYTDAVLTKPDTVRDEWWVFSEIARAARLPFFGNRFTEKLFDLNRRAAARPAVHQRLGLTHERLVGLFTLLGAGMTPRWLTKRYPHGRLLKPNRPGWFLRRGLLTKNRRVELAPVDFLEGAEAELQFAYERELRSKTTLKLIGKREKRGHNSWMHNAPALGGQAHQTNRLYMHPDDASEAGLGEGDLAEVGTDHGSVQVPVQITDDLMRYVVALPHGWGHRDSGLAYAKAHRAGVNVNRLAGDGAHNTERLSGMAHLTAFPVRVKPVGTPNRSKEQ